MGRRYFVPFVLAAAGAAFVAAVSLHVLPTPAALHANERTLAAYNAAHPLRLAAIFVVTYVALAPLPVPCAELLTISAGAVFGLLEGMFLVSLATMIGSCGAFLLGRFLLGGIVRRHFADRIGGFARRIEKEGAFYLFALHMIPAAPFFIINMAMGATSLAPVTFCWVSQLGILPLIFAYVNAGSQIGRFHTFSGVLSPGLLATFAVLGLLPLAARWLHQLVFQLRRPCCPWADVPLCQLPPKPPET